MIAVVVISLYREPNHSIGEVPQRKGPRRNKERKQTPNKISGGDMISEILGLLTDHNTKRQAKLFLSVLPACNMHRRPAIYLQLTVVAAVVYVHSLPLFSCTVTNAELLAY